MATKIEKKDDVIVASIDKMKNGRFKTPLFRMKSNFSKTQIPQYCDYCEDTSYELLVDGKHSHRCCRCGRLWPE